MVLLALFALGGTACSDLEGVLPGDDVPGAAEEASEEPSAEDDDTAEDSDASGDEAAEDEAPADEAGEDEVEPITADDVERICADDAASATTAEELAPLIGATPDAFEELVCSSAAS